jgi:hypothetical protein
MNNDLSNWVLSMTLGSTALLVLAIIVILVRSRTPEMKLILIGSFMAIAAAMQANITGITVNAGQVGLTTGLVPSPLLKISVILTLAGVGLMLLGRVAPAATSGVETEHSDAI